ncbi:hypothetical protein AB6A40_003424 [Gnathostoma spinigerum]|uniref:RING-type E3 ubiquitin transferase n=1 Tax=Gnathostoma spinigerum TaxID=75299 RepID=A0ABD6E9J2_9BILA
MNNGTSAPDTVAGGKTLELTDYDLQRRPHRAINDSSEVRISTRLLSAELCCPICLDLLTTTMTTKECLHRFCNECITTALLRGNKECPTCRKKLVSKRSLRPDPNFDALINKIWPDRQIYEQMQQKAMDMFHQQSNVEALQKSIEAGMKAQAANRRQRVQGSYDYERKKRRPRAENPDRSSNNTPESNSPEGSGEGEMDIDQLHTRADDSSLISAGTSSSYQGMNETPSFLNGISLTAAGSNPDISDDSIDSDSDSSMCRSSDTSDSSSTSSSSSTSVPTRPSSVTNVGSGHAVCGNGASISNGASDRPSVEPSLPQLNGESHLVVPTFNSSSRDRTHKWLEENPSSPLTPDESMIDQLERRVDEDLDIADRRTDGEFIEIEIELLPAKSLLKRSNIPNPLLSRRYIRTREDTTMDHIGEFLYQMCNEELKISVSDATSGQHRSAAGASQNLSKEATNEECKKQPSSLRPEHFYVYSRFGGRSVNKIFGDETVLSALHAQRRGDHLMIFFDIAPPDLHVTSMLEEIVYDEYLK